MDDADLPFMSRLGLPADADARAIRRAYARELKQIDQAADPAGFQSLRAAYETALQFHHEYEAKAQQATVTSDQHDTAHAPAPQPDGTKPVARTDNLPPEQGEQQAWADEVFREFQAHCHGLADHGTTATLWREAIRQCLDDPRMFGITERDGFELRVATLLANGWQPGHEALLAAAIEEFDWRADRRRLLRLGYPSALLDMAIDQREIFDQQSDEVRYEQGRVIARLRDPSLPGTRQLVADTARLELLIARYPHWLAIITSAANIHRWREAVAALPALQRKMASIGQRRARDTMPRDSGFSPWWLVLIGIMIMGWLSTPDGRHPANATPPRVETATDYKSRGETQLSGGQYAEAIHSFKQALDLHPDDASAYAMLAIGHAWNGDPESGERALKQSADLDGSNALLFRARGIVALASGKQADAINALTHSLELEPNHVFTLMQRAYAYLDHGDDDKAVADAMAAQRIKPDFSISAYALQISVAVKHGNKAEAFRLSQAMLMHHPRSDMAYTFAARTYLNWNQRDDAIAMLTRGIAATPTAELYRMRARLRPPAESSEKHQDLVNALGLDPQSLAIIVAMAELYIEERNLGTATALLSKSINAQKLGVDEHIELLGLRGLTHRLSGADALAESDYTHARELADTATRRNNLSWLLAQHGTDLALALSLVDEALALSHKSGAALDTRGFILLQLGRYREALATYDSALAESKELSISQYGRGIAKLRLGDRIGGNADIKAAQAAQPDVARYFDSIGIRPE